jgi:hypothetical protein
MAQKLGRTKLRDLQPNFAGGLNIASDRSDLAADELWTANEIRFNVFGAATKRGGTQRIHAAAIAAFPVRGGYSWKASGTGVATELVVCNGTLYKTTYAIPATFTSIGAGLSTTAYPSFAAGPNAAGADRVYIADGGALLSTDGTTLSARIAGTPNVSSIFVYNRRLYGCGDPANPDLLYFSALDNFDTLGVTASGGGGALVRTAGTRDLQVGAALNASLALIHRESISRWTGFTQDDIAVQSGVEGFAADVGGTAPGSLVMNEKVGAFLSARGFYEISDGSYFAAGGLRPISTKIEPLVVGLNHTLFNRVRGVNSRSSREMWWYLPDVGMYCYNYRLLNKDTGVGPWSGPWQGIFTTAVVHSMWQTVDAAGLPIVLAGFGDGFVRRLDAPGVKLDDVLSDGTGGTNVTMGGTCHRMFFKSPTREKSFRKVWVTAALGGSSTFSVSVQCATGTATYTFPAVLGGQWGVPGKWGAPAKWGSIGATTRKADLSGRGQYCDIVFSETGPSTPIISRIEADSYDMGVRR